MQKKLMKNLLLVLTMVVLCFAVGVTASAETWDDYEYTVLDDGTVEITDYNGTATELKIPSVIEGKSVTSIGDHTFIACKNLTNITIPDSIINIGNEVFFECYNLTNITVDENNKNYSSDDYGVLFNKDKSTLIQYPIGNLRTAYYIPDSVSTIDDYAFYCYSGVNFLTTLTISENVTNIGVASCTNMPFLEKTIVKSMSSSLSEFSLCASEFRVSGISREDFVLLCKKYVDTDDEAIWKELDRYLEYGIFHIGTIYCHAGSTAEAYAIENGIDYVLTHFYEDEWTYDYDQMIRYHKCIHCDEYDSDFETIEIETPVDTEEKEDLFSKIIAWFKSLIDLIIRWFKK